jgi:hypothetical protein
MLTHRPNTLTGGLVRPAQHIQVKHDVRNLFLLVLYYIFIMPTILVLLSNNIEEADFDLFSEK